MADTKFTDTLVTDLTGVKIATETTTQKGHADPATLKTVLSLPADTNASLAGKSATSHNHDASYATTAQGAKADSALQPADILDEDDFATDSATKAPSQQSTGVRINAQALAYAQAVSRASFIVRLDDGISNADGGGGAGASVSVTPGRTWQGIETGTTGDNFASRWCGLPSGKKGTESIHRWTTDVDLDFEISPTTQAAGNEIWFAIWGCAVSENVTSVRYADLNLASFDYNQMIRVELRNRVVYLTCLGYHATNNVKAEAGGTYTVTTNEMPAFHLEFRSGSRITLYVWDDTTLTKVAELIHDGTTVVVPSVGGYTNQLIMGGKSSASGVSGLFNYGSLVKGYLPNRFFLIP